MKTKLLIFLFLAGSIIPNLLFAQFIQQGPKLVGTGAVGNPRQSSSVAISSDGNTAIVGGPFDSGETGAVWVFTRSGGVWTQQGPKLVGTGTVGASRQGISVAISSDGNTAIEGGYLDNGGMGAVWVFIRSAGVWTQQGPKLVVPFDGYFPNLGTSVAISSDGNTAVMGGPFDFANAGAVWIFTRSGGVWTQQGPKLIGTGFIGYSHQGSSVAISSDGNTVIDGGYGDNDTGAVWIFTRSAGIWTQQGPKLVGTGHFGYSYQGSSVAISSDGNTAIEGGYLDNGGIGAIWVFTRSGGTWSQQGSKLIGTGGLGQGRQGYSVAITADGNTAFVGSPYDSLNTGAVWVFSRNGGVWTQQGSKLVGTSSVGFPSQGYSVAISTDGTVIEGGFFDNSGAGAAWVFFNPSIGISQISSNIPAKFSLKQNYPNPFNPSSRIKFDIQKSSFIVIKIYDILGKEVSTLVNEQLHTGTYEINFEGTNLPSGVYFYKMYAAGYTESKKMILLK